MNWTTPSDLRQQVESSWNKGQILAGLAGGERLFPRRLVLKTPTSGEIAEQFEAVRRWAQALETTPHLRLEYRDFRHRLFGANRLPAEAWLDSAEAAIAFIGKRREAATFARICASTAASQPALLPWLQKRPLRALDHATDWDRLLAVVAWLQAHPRPGCYLRQMDLPGIDSKFVESRRGLLAELLDLALPPATIDASAGGSGGFNRRYGFRDKPERVRLRFLDPAGAPTALFANADLSLDAASFAALNPAVDRVFITENEVNFLAFPPVDRALLLFGAGYGFSVLADASWLHDKAIHYWGDIDTHGFAILAQLRNQFPQVRSLLMDRATLLAHQSLWGEEGSPVAAELQYLDDAERTLYDDLRSQRHGRHVRLEQERIAYGIFLNALAGLRASAH